MLLYLAGYLDVKRQEMIADKAAQMVLTGRGRDANWTWVRPNNFLFSFAFEGAKESARHFCAQPHRRIFIDSGAYSVWTLGAEVDLGEYITFCKEIQGLAKCPVVFVALDVIPGKFGETPTPAEKEKACEEGWANYQVMKQEGIYPCLPTFHQGEHIRWLNRIADDCDYFAMSHSKRADERAENFDWYRRNFQHIGLTKKIHGLGVASTKLMKGFPFFSVDSSWWTIPGRFHLRPSSRKLISLKQWEKWGLERGLDTQYLKAMLGFGTADPDGNFGAYWLDTLAMGVEVETQAKITEFWREKGVVWDDDVYRGAKLLADEPIGVSKQAEG